jgi:ketosteroid isomerase-like protein
MLRAFTGPLCIGIMMLFNVAHADSPPATAAHKELKQFYDDFQKTLNSDAFPKDPSPGLAFFDPDTTLFDVGEPESITGADFRKHFIEIASQSPAKIEISNLEINASADGKMAFVHFIQRAYGSWHDGTPFNVRWRTTDCLLKKSGHWKIVHEHNSIPLDEATMIAVMTKKSIK